MGVAISPIAELAPLPVGRRDFPRFGVSPPPGPGSGALRRGAVNGDATIRLGDLEVSALTAPPRVYVHLFYSHSLFQATLFVVTRDNITTFSEGMIDINIPQLFALLLCTTHKKTGGWVRYGEHNFFLGKSEPPAPRFTSGKKVIRGN